MHEISVAILRNHKRIVQVPNIPSQTDVDTVMEIPEFLKLLVV